MTEDEMLAVYDKGWKDRLAEIRTTRPTFKPYDAHIAGLKAVATAALEEVQGALKGKKK